MRDHFLQSVADGEDPFLLFSGDLIHGPNCEPAEWPAYLGDHYYDESGDVVEEFIQLQEAHPGRVACLIGNHEHSHVGGPHTPKFWADETAYFEESVGPERAVRYNRLFRTFPTVAVTHCGVVVTHAAPNAVISGPEDIEMIKYEGFENVMVLATSEMELLGSLIWSRNCEPKVARAFLDALSRGGPRLDIVVFGHEIVSDGYIRVGDEQLMLSTSFGVRQRNKYFLKVDLSGRYRKSEDLRVGQEILQLYGPSPS